jgi:hypothetical protein
MNKEEAAEILREAVEVLDAASISPALQSAALSELIKLLAPTSSSEPSVVESSPSIPQGVSAPSLTRLAQKVGLTLEVLGDLFVVEGNELQLAIPSRKLAETKKEGTVEVAVLVCVGRQGTGLDEEWTSVSEIRKWATEFSRYDDKHFGEHLQLADNLLTIVGKGTQRKFRVKWNEAETIKEVITQVRERA